MVKAVVEGVVVKAVEMQRLAANRSSASKALANPSVTFLTTGEKNPASQTCGTE